MALNVVLVLLLLALEDTIRSWTLMRGSGQIRFGSSAVSSCNGIGKVSCTSLRKSELMALLIDVVNTICVWICSRNIFNCLDEKRLARSRRRIREDPETEEISMPRQLVMASKLPTVCSNAGTV